MPTFDSARANYVTQEYRYAVAPSTAVSAAIKAKYDKAKVIEIETNLDEDGAEELASDIAAMTSKMVRTFTVPLETIITGDDLIDGFPRYLLDFERYASVGTNPYDSISLKVDASTNRTTVTVRGS